MVEMLKQQNIPGGRQSGWRGCGLAMVTIGLVIFSIWPRQTINTSHAEAAHPRQGLPVTGSSNRPWTGWREVESGHQLRFEEITVPASRVRWTANRVSVDLPWVVEVPLVSESPGRWRGRVQSEVGARGVTPFTNREVEVSGFRSASRESLLVTIHQAEMGSGGGTVGETLVRIYLGREVSEGATVP